MTPSSIQSARLDLVFVPNRAGQTPGLAAGTSGGFRLGWKGRTAGALSLVRTGPGHAVIGYEIAPNFRGMGLASEAVLAIVAAARSFGLTQLSAQCRSNNTASRRVLEKAGFILASAVPFAASGPDASITYMIYQRTVVPAESHAS
jgi:RimJ/RimL family protein N-acetyltransferase